MARPIKETPVVKGKDAKRFWVKKDSETGRYVDTKTSDRMKENFQKINSLSKSR